MRKILLTMALIALGSLSIQAQEDGIFTAGTINYRIIDDNSVSVTGTTQKSGIIDIPATVIDDNNHSYSVVSIAANAFAGKNISKVTIPNSVREIGKEAFKRCQVLSRVTMPENAVLNEGIFQACSRIDSVTLPRNITKIPKNLFASSQIKTVFVPQGVDSVGDGAFSGTPITDINFLPSSVRHLGKDAFTMSKIKSANLPNSLLSIGPGCFSDCDSLTTIHVTNTTNIIGKYAFEYCQSLQSITVDEDNPNYCSQDGVMFNKDKTVLYAFPGGKPGEYTIPSSVTEIADSSFSGCKNLTSITIHKDVAKLGRRSFYCCNKLASVTNYSVEPQEFVDLFINASNNLKIYVDYHSLAAYKAAEGWKDESIEEIEGSGIYELAPQEEQYKSIFQLNGTESSTLHKGINIIRMKNGETKKVLVP